MQYVGEGEKQMVPEHQHSFFAAKLLTRLRALNLTLDVGNGTPLAAAAATLIAQDAVEAGLTLDQIDRVSDEALVHAAIDVQFLLSGKIAQGIVLPFGTAATSRVRGAATIAGVSYTLVAARPGMMDEDEAPAGHGGANLDLLLSLIEKQTSKLACRRLGPPRAVTLSYDEDEVVLRFPPEASAGGVSLEYCMGGRPLEWLLTEDVHEYAKAVVKAMRHFWRERSEVSEAAANIHQAMQEVLAEHEPADKPISLASLAMRPADDWPLAKTGIYLEFHMLDHALRDGIDWSFILRPEDARRIISRVAQLNDMRVGDRSNGEHNSMDAMAAAIAEAAPEGVEAVLERLKSNLATEVLLPIGKGKRLAARLSWNYGQVTARIYRTGEITYRSNVLTLFDVAVPATILTALPGKLMSDVVALPMHCPFKIEHVADRRAREMQFTLQTGNRIVDWERSAIAPF